MRALPNMTVTAVCDAEEMTRLMDATLDWPHPIYIRLGKGGDPVISKPERGFAIGKAIDMIDGETGASDVLLVATGVATTQALKAAALAGGGRHPLPAAARPHRQAARRRCHRRRRSRDQAGRHRRGAQRHRRPGQRRARDAVGPDHRRAAAAQAARHPGQVRRALRQPAEADGRLRLRCQEHRPGGAQARWRSSVGEQRPQLLARRGARAGRRLRARRLCHHPGRIARRPRPDSRSHGRYRRVLPQAAAARGQGRVPRPHPRQGRRPAPERSSPRRDPRDERGAVDAAVLLQHRAPGARDPGRQRAGHAASHQSQHPASRRRQLAAAGPCRCLGRRFAVRSRPVDSRTSTSSARRRCSSCRATRMPAIRRGWAS